MDLSDYQIVGEKMRVKHNRTCQRGFTLTEIGIVLVIVGLLVSGTVAGLATYRGVTKQKQTDDYLERARNALLTYVAVNEYLPCPDTNGDAKEDRNGDRCTDARGELPTFDIGIERNTPWGAPAFYAVNEQAVTTDCDPNATTDNEGQCFFWSGDQHFNLETNGEDGEIKLLDPTEDVAARIQVVIGSRGENSLTGCPPAASHPDENENCNDDRTYVTRTYAKDTFDDQIVWIDELDLKSRWLEAQASNSGSIGFPDSEGNGPQSCDDVTGPCREGTDGDDDGASDPNFNGSDDSETIIGKNGDDTIDGGDGDDVIYGGEGDDTVSGGDGNDTIHGGDGNDLILLGHSNVDIDAVDGGQGNDTIDLLVDCTGRNVTYKVGTSTHNLTPGGGTVTIGVERSGILRVDGRIRAFFINIENLSVRAIGVCR